MTLLVIHDLNITLQDKTILSELDLNLEQGEILGLVGASGCGKTTLLNAIAGFNKLSKGQISIDGHLLSDGEKVVPAEQRQVGMIFQDYALFPHLNVRENIAFGIAKLSKAEQNARIDKLLEILKLNEHDAKYIHQLSGGQQQRVAIARALAPQPKLLLLDEPFSNIDARLRNELMLEIRLLLKQLNTTAIFVTHNKDEVFTFADKMAVMAEGKLLQFDSPINICRKPNSYQVADFLQLGSWLPCKIDGHEATSLLGKLNITDSEFDMTTSQQFQLVNLLVKPQQLSLIEKLTEHKQANAQVEYISVTEQGYHYGLRNLDSAVATDELAFNKLSLYSDIELSINQQVAVNIKPHNFLFFK
jgi:iron(III) transport system ATP-binding protein